MNGRLYDPVLGRMLSPDNYVQAPDNTQSYNRYSYCINNPLKFTDPSGNIFWLPIIAGAIIGSYIGGSMANDNNFNPTEWDYESGKTWRGIGIGAVVGGGLGYLIAGGVPLVVSGTTPMGNVPLLKLALGSKYTTLSLLPFPGFVGYKGIEFTIKQNKINIDPHSWFMNDYDRIVWQQQQSTPTPQSEWGDVYASNFSQSATNGNSGMKQVYYGSELSIPTLVNKSNSTIWLKPENNSLSPMSLAPGKSTTMRIDGVTHPNYPGKVFKVNTLFEVTFGIEVNRNGVIVGANSALWPFPAEFNYLFGGGWLTDPPDNGWNDIFNKAGYKKP
jgi:hypothetical protein